MVVTLDLDGCLVDFPQALADRLSKRMKREFLTSEMLTYNVEGFVPSQYWTWVNKLLKDPKFYDECEPMKDAVTCVEKLATMFDLVVITNRPKVLINQTVAYVKKHFPKVSEIIFNNGPSKIPLISEWMPVAHLDDKPTTCFDLAEAGLETISCVFDQPFNRQLADTFLYPKLRRFTNFDRFEDYLTSIWLAT